MPAETASGSSEAFRLLGRVWNRLVWSALVVIIALLDGAALFVPPADAVQGFLLGLATGLIVAGFLVTVSRERLRSRALGPGRTR